MEKSTQPVHVAIFLTLVLCLAVTGCKPEGAINAGPVDGYRFQFGDTVLEARTVCQGVSEVPWAQGVTATRYESSLITVHDGFALPDAFIARWQRELTRARVAYVKDDGEALADMGWALYSSADRTNLQAAIEFASPLPLWATGTDRIRNSARAHIVKGDAIGLFAPRTTLKGKPELEGDLTATLTCEHFQRDASAIAFDYELTLTGQGVMRSFPAQGEEWLGNTLPADREETCIISIIRKGQQALRKEGGAWHLLRDSYRETWEAHSLQSDLSIRESSLSGADEAYSLTVADLPPRVPAAPGAEVNVRDFGAVGDGARLDTAAINAAIQACHQAGGGTVSFPPGVYLSGSIHMQSQVTLKLQAGAIIRGTLAMDKYDPREENPWDAYQDSSHSYFHRSLIWGENLTNVGFVGPGMIDGNDAFENWPIIHATPPPPLGWILSTIFYQLNDELFQRGPKPLTLKACENVFIKDIVITHAPDEAILFIGCNRVLIDGYKAREVRVDGMDPVCSSHVTITGCEIKSLDDAIAIKSSYALGYKRDCENITVKNCLLSTFINALKIGTESVGDFRDIAFHHCVIHNPDKFPSFAGLSMMSVDGGTLDGIEADDIVMENANYPIFIRVGDRLRTPEQATIGTVRNVRIRNFVAAGGLGTGASSITAVEGSYVGENIVLEDISITCKGGRPKFASSRAVPEVRESSGVYPDPPYIVPGIPPAYGFFCRHVRGLAFHDVQLGFTLPDRRAALIFEDVDDLVLEGVAAERAACGAPSIIMRE